MSVNRVIRHAAETDAFGAVVSWQRQQYAFMRIMQAPGVGNHINMMVPQEQLELCQSLIYEEVRKELFPALEAFAAAQSLENRVEVADACIDSIYVILQLMNTLGLPAEALFAEVHRSNMAKRDPKTGEVKRREDGKVLKPDSWTPPNLWEVCKRESDRVNELTMLPPCTKAGE